MPTRAFTARRLALGLTFAAAVAVPSVLPATAIASTTAVATGTVGVRGAFGTIENRTGRHLKGAHFVSGGRSSCHVWNKDGNSTYKPVTWRCSGTDVRPHTTTGFWDDMDGVTVLSSGYYYVRFGAGGHDRKVSAGTYTRFHDHQRATCRSGAHVHCVVD
ncbi:hypothetical protein [Streptomyces sp. NPDC046805]|uniref:hypothetical protein n=1 Tax=Streptomyces sp. NPDC046805 TaxID=3155134 RepID=UPI0033D2D7A7